MIMEELISSLNGDFGEIGKQLIWVVREANALSHERMSTYSSHIYKVIHIGL